MITADYFLLCENVVVDQSDKVSIINIFDEVHVPVLPASHPHFMITFRIFPDESVRKAGKIDFKITLEDPLNNEFFKAQGGASIVGKLKTPVSRVSSSIDLAGIVLKEAGSYMAKLYVSDKLVASKKFDVVIQDEVAH